MSNFLKIGDVSPNGQVNIVDEDRLCYLVKSVSKGAVGLRTISKRLLNEFVDYFRQNPESKSEDARSALAGNSEIDKFEYGYASTLREMANMVLDKSDKPHFINSPKSSETTSQNIQQIFYGAPGTGKSFTINRDTEGEDVIRTTFHPDTDYSSFVGAYKPTTIEVPVMTVLGTELVPVENAKPEKKIIYEFISQSFLQAYVAAWQKYARAEDGKPKKQYLVIEEINRGNCAQIFGDLFQLLDRNDQGFSDYPITADTDLRNKLKEMFEGCSIKDKDTINSQYNGRDVVDEVLNGDILLLPNNLYIWATMNTSDQSLFPIDSAFKRRWNWRYIPISNRNMGYMIEVNGAYYDWWEFLTAINSRIWDANHSEDKKLGYFFAKADGDNIINAELFAGKVIFYLWNDVFKDFIDETGGIFNDADGTMLTFDKFYDTLPSGETKVVPSKVEQFLKNLSLVPKERKEPQIFRDETFTKDHLKITFFDGTIIEYNSSTDSLVKFVELVGPQRVAETNVMANKQQTLISEQDIPSCNAKLVDGTGYYVMTKFSVPEMFARVFKVSKKLELNCDIDIVEVEN